MGTITQNNYTSLRITEQEYIKIITRTIKELDKIDQAKFNSYVNNSSAGGQRITKLTTDYPTDYPASTFTATNVKS
jgi:hypothetical protein